ncbi:hypothetical protein AB0F17_30155 [Nonomuraea sp. NPDC026600]|uniref:AMP-binding protein n=1 Tax=Nonomuraea sp. NPDC026600 TaxID=3155363 RepID=UPI0033C04039
MTMIDTTAVGFYRIAASHPDFELVLAVAQIGLYLVPINTHLEPAEVAFIVRDSGAKVLAAHADLAASLAGESAGLPAARFADGGEVAGWRPYEELAGSPAEPEGRTAGNATPAATTGSSISRPSPACRARQGSPTTPPPRWASSA